MGIFLGGLRCKHGLIKWRFLQPCLSGCSIQKWEIHQEERCFLTVLDAIAPVSTHIGIVKFPIDKWFSRWSSVWIGDFPYMFDYQRVECGLDEVWEPEWRILFVFIRKDLERMTHLLVLCSMLSSMEAFKDFVAKTTLQLKTALHAIYSVYI